MIKVIGTIFPTTIPMKSRSVENIEPYFKKANVSRLSCDVRVGIVLKSRTFDLHVGVVYGSAMTC